MILLKVVVLSCLMSYHISWLFALSLSLYSSVLRYEKIENQIHSFILNFYMEMYAIGYHDIRLKG